MASGYKTVAGSLVFICTISALPASAHNDSIGRSLNATSGATEPPAVTTQAPANVTISSATLRGTINPHNSETTFYFDWGTSAEYGNRTASQTLPAGENVVEVSAELTGLAVATQYNFRLVAENAGGRSTGENVSFTTGTPAPSAPILLSPANGAEGITEPVTLRWSSSFGAASYRVQVSNASNFASGNLVTDQSNLSGTEYQVTGLAPGATYHWRARASGQGGSSSWSSSRRFTMAAAPPTVETLPADDVTVSSARLRGSMTSASEQNEVFFEWGTTESLGNQTATQQHTGAPEPVEITANLSGLAANRQYFFRFVARNDGGTSRGDVLSFHTGAPPPDSPVLLSPSDGATGTPTTPELRWSPSANATSYRVEVGRAGDFSSSVVFSDQLSGTSVTVPDGTLSQQGTYSWRVRGVGDGGAGPWSTVWSFTTRGDGPDVTTLAATDVGQSSAVLHGRVDPRGERTHVHFEWGTSSAYGNQTSTTVVEPDAESADVSAAISGLASGGTYHYRIVGENDGGKTEGHDRSFATGTPPPPSPGLVSPANNQDNVSLKVRLEWSSVNGATSYDLEVSQDAGFSALVVDQSGLSVPHYSVEEGVLQHSTSYHWRARAVGAGGAGVWSDSRIFATAGGKPAVVTGEATAVTTTRASLRGIVTANGSETLAFFEWGLNGSFTNSTVPQTIPESGTDVEVVSILEGLAPGRDYTFRLVASNAGGRAEGASRTFRTRDESAFGAPTLASPPDGTRDLPASVTLNWNAVTGAVSYEVQAASQIDFATDALVVSQSNVSETRYTVNELEKGKQYYWRVRANQVTVQSEWSSIWTFSTQASPTAIGRPALVSPVHSATAVSTSPTLTWETVSQATAYRVQVAHNSSFLQDSLITNANGVSSTSMQLNGLAGGQTFYWRVAAQRGNENGSWSDPWTFTTYPEKVSLGLEHVFANPDRSNSYRMIGIPGDVNLPMTDVLSGRPEEDWIAFYDDGRSQSELVRYDGSTLFNFRPGRAFWVLGRNPISFEDEVPSARIGSDGTIAIPVNPGWTIISNPFDVPVRWAEVQELNNVEAFLWRFEGSFSSSSDLQPYEGYYFNNENGLTQLRIPYPGRNGVSAIITSHNPGLTLSLRSSTGVASSVLVEIDPSAKLPFEGRAAPPARFELASARIIAEGSDVIFATVSTEGTRRQILLSNPTSENMQLTPQYAATWSGYRAALIDLKLGHFIALDDGQPALTLAAGESRSLDLVVGPERYVSEAAASVEPTSFALLPNYPNPFNPATTLVFTIPEASEVHVEVFDVNGRQVAVPYTGYTEPGYHEVTWHPSGNTGDLASGLYFVRMQAGGFSAVQPVMLLK